MTDRESLRRERLHREAVGYLELRLFEHTLATLGRLAPIDRHHPLSLYLEGEALRSLERYDQALPPLLEAARLEPQDVEVRLAIGWCQKRRDRLDLAILALEEALKVEPAHALTLYNLACYYCLAGKREKSLSHLQRALREDPTLDDLIDEEADFDALRYDPEFIAARKNRA